VVDWACLHPGAGGAAMIGIQKAPTPERSSSQEKIMNTIIYIVGLVVIIGVILSFFGLR
jgi:hypothetical protein